MVLRLVALCAVAGAAAGQQTPNAYQKTHRWNSSEALTRALAADDFLAARLRDETSKVEAPAPWALTSSRALVKKVNEMELFERNHVGEKRVELSKARADGRAVTKPHGALKVHLCAAA